MKLDETFLPIDAIPPPPRADVIQVGAFEPRSPLLSSLPAVSGSW